jgi:hypothetical protein
MTGEKDIQQRRLAERRAHRLALTDDVKRLMEALNRDSPEEWRSYRATVDQEGILEADVHNRIIQTAFALFPGRETRDIADLLERMIEMTRSELGKGDWKV